MKIAIVSKIKIFLREVYAEIKKTSWLSRREVFRYTFIVLLVSVVVAAFLGGLDYLFSVVLQGIVF